MSMVLSAGTVRAATTSLYDRMLDLSRQEMQIDANGAPSAERDILRSVAQWLPLIHDPDAVTPEEVLDLVSGGAVLCNREGLNPESECPRLRETARSIVSREEKIRSLERDLYGEIAGSFEEPLLGGSLAPLPQRIQGIAQMWQADVSGASSSAAGTHIRTEDLPQAGPLRGSIGAIAAAIAQEAPSSDADVTAAIVNRYRFAGVEWLRGKRPDLSVPSNDQLSATTGTEFSLAQKRWPAVEDALENLEKELLSQTESLSIAPGETVLFSFPSDVTDALPDNVTVWAYVERGVTGGLTGDAGLDWTQALDPPPLALVGGGHYPAPPPMHAHTPLCTLPLMRSGLLCRSAQTEESAVCAESSDPSSSADIQLAACTAPQPDRELPPGGDACAALGNVCTPLTQTQLRTSIGNLTCYINRCLTQSLTQNRLVPGRTPLTEGDGAFPFDLCLKPDPQLGLVMPAASPLSAWVPRPYEPALLLKHLEESLCPGMPLGSPLCTFRPSLSLDDALQMSSSFVTQSAQFNEPGLALRQLAEAIGMRIGTDLYGEFFAHRLSELTDFAHEASALLREFTRASFPRQMCSMNATSDGSLCAGTETNASSDSSPTP